MRYKELQPVREITDDYEAIEKEILLILRRTIYLPVLRELKKPLKLKNTTDDLLEAIRSGRIQYSRGAFSGAFDAAVSRELKKIGATWDRRSSTWRLPSRALTIEMRTAISGSISRYQAMVSRVDAALSKVLPANIAEQVKLQKLFASTLWKTDKAVQRSMKGVGVVPKLSDSQAARISEDYTANLDKYITDFTEKETLALRKRIHTNVLEGKRYQDLVGEIQKSYAVSQNKAKFLARQETNLMMAAFKQTRYEDAGVREYIWGCVKMPHQSKGAPYKPGEVRYDHGILEGKVFRWDSPPVTSPDGRRNNPGTDFGCRCFARPVVKF